MMSNAGKVFRCDIPIFGRSVLTVINCSEHDAIKTFCDYVGKDLNLTKPSLDMTHDADGWCQHSGGDLYIWVKNESSSILIHEFVHAAFGICRLTGAGADEEIIARLVEYLKLNLLDEIYDEGGEDDE